MKISDIKKFLNSKKQKIGEKFLNKFLSSEFKIKNLDDIDNINISDQEIENKYNLLKKIINLSESYEKMITLNDFIDNLIIDFNLEGFDKAEYKNFYEIIYDIYLLDNNHISDIDNGYDINFGGTFKFFKINLSDFQSSDDFYDKFYDNLKNINNEFKKLSGSDKSIILPYENNLNNYFIVNYSYDKNNKILNNISTSEKKIPSSSSFYFFFKEIKLGDQIDLIIIFRQSFQTNKIELIKKSIDKFLGKVCFFDSLDLISFEDFKNNGYLPTIDGNVDILSAKISHQNIKSLIQIDGNKSIDDTNKLFNKADYNINEVRLEYKKYEGKDLKIKLLGSIKTDSISLEGKKLNIIRFIYILEGLKLISFDNINDTFSFEDFFIDSIFNGKIYLSRKHFKGFDIIKNYINNYTYCGSIEGYTGKNISESSLDFAHNKVILDSDRKDKLDGNVISEINIGKILNDKSSFKIDFNYINEVGEISLSKQNKNSNVKILFASKIQNLTAHLSNQSNIESTKFIAFIDSNFTDLQKINIIDKFNCLLYQKTSIPSFFNDIGAFIEQESNMIFLERDRNIIKIVKRGNGDKELNIFKSSLSGNGDLFEKHVADILSFFFPIFVSLGMKYKGESVPDGLMINKQGESLFMYDAKSSLNVREYINKEVLKFKEYITALFPEGNNNIFFIIGPNSTKSLDEIHSENIESLGNNINWKTLIEREKGKILYMGADILDFLHHILMFPDIVNLKGQIDLSKFTNYFTELLPNPGIKKIELEDFIYNFSKFIFKSPEDGHKAFKDFSEKMEKRTNKKVDLIGISDNFKKHIDDYKSLNI